MGRPKIATDEQILEAVSRLGVGGAAGLLGYSHHVGVSKRLRQMGVPPGNIGGPSAERSPVRVTSEHPARVTLEVIDGHVIVGSDAHYWPGLGRSVAHSALVRLVGDLAPVAVVVNGDVIDAPSISKHAAIGWEKRPDLWDEVLVAKERLQEIEDLTPGHLIWNLGNHDARFETFLAANAAQYRGVQGIHLKDHFPSWTPAWSTWINPDTDPTVIKHRIGGGEQALIRNIQKAGTHIITGHTHAANVWAFSNYVGTFYGVDTGTMAVPYGPQFTNWTEDNPVNWRSSITVLTFSGGRLLPPEQLIVINEEERLTAFRGAIHQEEA